MNNVDGATLLAIYKTATLIKQTDERIRELLGAGALTDTVVGWRLTAQHRRRTTDRRRRRGTTKM
jgi:hypothetical protein